MSSTIRITDRAHRTVRELAERSGKTLQATLEEAIEELRRKRFFEEANAAYAALRADTKAWNEEEEERNLWESTLGDGQEEE